MTATRPVAQPGSARRGLAWLAVGSVGQRGAQFGFGVVLARLLDPVDFGLVAIGTLVVGLTEVVTIAGGLSAVMVQRQGEVEAEWSLFYWSCATIGLLSSIAVWAVAPVMARVFFDERLVGIVRGLSVVPVLTGLATAQIAWLQKHLEFRKIVWIEGMSEVFGGAMGLIVAWKGGGVWSLVVRAIVSAATAAVLLPITSHWRPGRLLRVKALRQIVVPSLHIQGMLFSNFLSRRLDEALLGRYVGPEGLSYYARAYQLMIYPVEGLGSIMGRVCFPVLARLQADQEVFKRTYLRGLLLVGTCSFPVLMGLAAIAPAMIGAIYGAKWAPVAPILQVLCVAGIVRSLGATANWIFLARNRSEIMLRWSIVTGVVTYAAFVAGVGWGIKGIVCAYVSTNLLLVPASTVAALRVGKVRFGEFMETLREPFLSALLMAGTMCALRWWLASRGWGDGEITVATALCGAGVYLAGLVVARGRALEELKGAIADLSEGRWFGRTEGKAN